MYSVTHVSRLVKGFFEHGIAAEYHRPVQTQPAITLHATLTLADVKRFQYFHALRRGWLAVVLFGLALIILVLFLVVRVVSDPQSGLPLLINAIPFLFLLLFWVFAMCCLPYLAARRMFAAQRVLREPVTWVFTSEGVSSSGPSASSSFVWDVLKALRETTSLFLLYTAPNAAHIVPKRLFATPDEIEQWRQMVEAYAAPRRMEKPGLVGRWC
jgi:hypothetical protein